ncbi:MAG: T9SS type B sorting domain-containing protein [Nitritalea sp.]
MKHSYRSIQHAFGRAFWALLLFLAFPFWAGAQGVNRNIWLFGDCQPGRAFLSFGAEEQVSAVPLGETSIAGRQPLGRNTVATAINQVTGNLLFYTNGEFVYDGNHNSFGSGNLSGDTGNLQAVAIAVGAFDIDPASTDSYFIFYITPSGDLGFQQIGVTGDVVSRVGTPNNNFRPGVGPAIKLIDNPNVDNASFLFYYSGGELRALDIQGNDPGAWDEQDGLALANAPVQIRYNAEENQVIVVGANNVLTLIDFDPATGELSNARPLTPPGAGTVGGMTFSADGAYLFVSLTNPTTNQGTLRRYNLAAASWDPSVPIGDVSPVPTAVRDIRVGPNGRLYVLYEIQGSDRVKIAELENPEEALVGDFNWVEDRFPGIDFCARMFPTFSTTVSFMPTVEIIAPPGELCSDSPVPLVTRILPLGLQATAFEWTYSDQEGNSETIEDVEHLVVPGGVSAANVTVTFADGTEVTASVSLMLGSAGPEVELQLDEDLVCPCADPSDVENQGVNLAEGLQIDGQDPSPSFEYFWSAYPERGWSTNSDAFVCEPGTYYVLVRRVGETCYGIGEVELRVVNNDDGGVLPSGRNGRWFFGDGAGIDFNDYPLFPTVPGSPRPLDVPELDGLVPEQTVQRIFPNTLPDAVDVFYDISGNVIFYTDGETVWDFFHNALPLDPQVLGAGGAAGGTGTPTLGGDARARQGALIVPYPDPELQQMQTLYYIFTPTVEAPHGVLFHMVDLRRGSPLVTSTLEAPGNVISANNLLFQPGTQQSAAFLGGGRNLVAFKEMGSPNYRLYTLDQDGISVAKRDGTGDFTPGDQEIAGVMQFSIDGQRLGSAYSYRLADGSLQTTIEVFTISGGPGEDDDDANGGNGMNGNGPNGNGGNGINGEDEEDEDEDEEEEDNDPDENLGPDADERNERRNRTQLKLKSTFTVSGEVFGIEFSIPGDRLYVTLDGNIEEFFLEDQDVSNEDATPPSFIDAFNEAENVTTFSAAVLSSRTQIESGNFRAIQRSPEQLNQLLVGELGQGAIGVLLEGRFSDIESQFQPDFLTFSKEGTLGNSLPRFRLAGGGGGAAPPELFGDREICLENVTPGVVPITGTATLVLTAFLEDRDDVRWRVRRTFRGQVSTVPVQPDPQMPENESEFFFTFTEPGDYSISLFVKRCEFIFPPLEHRVRVVAPPLILPEQLSFCDDGSDLILRAIDTRFADPNDFSIIWRDVNGIRSTENELILSNPNDVGQYTVEVAAVLSDGTECNPITTQIFVGPPRGLNLGVDQPIICHDGSLRAFPFLGPGPAVSPSVDEGIFRVFEGTSTLGAPVLTLTNANELEIRARDLPGPGLYTVEFEVEDEFAKSSDPAFAPKCIVVLTETFEVLPPPQLEIRTLAAPDCGVSSGEISIEGLDLSAFPTNISFNGRPIRIELDGVDVTSTGTTFGVVPDPAGDVLQLTGFPPGAFSVRTVDLVLDCTFDETVIVPDASQPVNVPNFEVNSIPARCGPDGEDGTLLIQFPPNFTGSFEVRTVATLGGLAPPAPFIGSTVPGSAQASVVRPAGTYIVSFQDADGCFVTAVDAEIENLVGQPIEEAVSFCFATSGNRRLPIPAFIDLMDSTVSAYRWLAANGDTLLSIDPTNLPLDTEFNVPEEGVYTLAIDYPTCTLEVTYTVTDVCELQVNAPNAVRLSGRRTPRGEGKLRDNVVTLATSNYVQEVEVFIYNRWGQLIHVYEYQTQSSEAIHLEEVWDGRVNGEFVPAGTYIMIIILRNRDDNVEKRIEKPLFVIR